MRLSTQITSIIRISIAAAVGTLIRVVLNKWAIDIDGETLTSAITGAAIGAYYAVAKWAEGRWPALRMLGLADPDTAG